MKRTVLSISLLAGLGTAPLAAAGKPAPTVSVTNAWARETAPSQVNGGGFATIANTGTVDDRLVSAASPVASEVQLHTMSMDGGVMRMRQLTDGIAVPAGQTVMLKPGSLHVMFIGLKHPLKRGENVPVTLRFARAGTVKVNFAVQPVGAMGPGGRHGGH
ncbi:copper chaperone PCu(A)C [Novosphingobium mangrovi (ex Huang et al. 2023)]|uniref:Copper chaperone PCu(A)C n=1 Tax=Novosphingobium mangrovi (ex Huang et al. 2023) TaxID=2976432 RepID=A0ABT2I0V6_9SPHN|nr:copper chaperone PCu(A)C [Novosphingobium mangrovi (ex Huang et al. 2023)]MCT2398433.1 copper chaperone PCu(A)C [Novosphingobium mangrovi (ex Huang et al. 2023)]